MKKLIYSSLTIIILSSISFQGKCQYNLVSNPSFEMYDNCPSSLGQLTNATHWTKPITNVSPEFFHVCGTIWTGVPQNKMGYQLARTGLGYAGIGNAIVNLSNPNQTFREYIQTELIDSLLPGVEYTISFYVSAGDSCGRHTNNFGAYFSNTEIDTVIYPYSNLSFQPQFENPVTNDISDRIGWTQLTGTFFANGGEKYLILGNFRDTPNTTIIITGWGTNPSFATSAYLYIDDILVTPTDSITSINEFNSNQNLSISTLSGNEFEINSQNQPINSYEIINCLGQIIEKRMNVNQKTLHLNVQGSANGIYFVRLILNNEKKYILKIFKT